MTEPSPLRSGLITIAALTVVGLMVMVTTAYTPPNTTGIGPAPTSLYSDFGAGAVTLYRWQNVTATPYWYTYCSSPNPASSCTVPAGIVYVAPAHSIVFTQDRAGAGGFYGGTDAVTIFDPDTMQTQAAERLTCSPEVPFYPGVGIEVFIPCLNSSSAWSSVLVVNAETGMVSANLSIPFTMYYTSMAYDPSHGILYVATDANTIARINTVNDTVAGTLAVSGADWGPSGHIFAIVFDPSTGALLVPWAGGGLLAFNPITGANRILSLPAVPVTLTMDVGANRILATSFDPSSVFVYNASSYRLIAALSIPNCLDNVCAEPNDVNQVLVDPVHGDAYLLSTESLITLNLSALDLIGSTPDYGDGPSWSATYVPPNDRIFGTYTPILVGPGFMIQLGHGGFVRLTRLLWLPVDLGILALAVLTGSALALSRAWVARRSAR